MQVKHPCNLKSLKHIANIALACLTHKWQLFNVKKIPVSQLKSPVNSFLQCIENECNAPTQDKHIFRMEEAFKPIESPYFEILDELDDVFVIHHYVGEVS